MTPREERDKYICKAYSEEGATAENIALEWGLSLSAVRLILRTNQVKKEKPTPEQRALALATKKQNPKTIGDQHVKIGQRLSHFRSFTLVLDRPATAQKLGWTTQKLASVEKGIFNLTLRDVEDLAGLFKEDTATFLTNTPKKPNADADANVIDMEPIDVNSTVLRPPLLR